MLSWVPVTVGCVGIARRFAENERTVDVIFVIAVAFVRAIVVPIFRSDTVVPRSTWRGRASSTRSFRYAQLSRATALPLALALLWRWTVNLMKFTEESFVLAMCHNVCDTSIFLVHSKLWAAIKNDGGHICEIKKHVYCEIKKHAHYGDFAQHYSTLLALVGR